MPMYSTCPKCGNETSDGTCIPCLYTEKERLEEDNLKFADANNLLHQEIERLKEQLGHRDKWLAEQKALNELAYDLEKMDDETVAKLGIRQETKTFGWVGTLCKEIERLKAGRFTEGEFQNLCHTCSEIDCDNFQQGCFRYWVKLFGRERAMTVLESRIIEVIGGQRWPLSTKELAEVVVEGLAKEE